MTSVRRERRLAIVVASLGGGGAERVAALLASGLSDRGHPVDVISLCESGTNAELLDSAVDLDVIGAHRCIAATSALARRLKSRPYDAVLALQANACYSTVLAHRLARSDARLVISERSTASERLRHSSRASRVINWALIQALYPMADEIVTPSDASAKDLSDLLVRRGARVRRIYNPIVSQELSERLEAEPSIQITDEPPGETVIAIGRLSAEKRPLDVVEAIALVNKRTPTRLLMLGEGSMRQEIVDRARKLGVLDRVLLPGFIQNPYPLLKKANVLVLASEREGLPGVLIEALAAGTPVVAADCPSGPREILLDGELGRLVPVGHTEALASAIEATISEGVKPVDRSGLDRFRAEQVLDEYEKTLGLAP